MATNLLVPVFSGSLAGEMVYPVTAYVVPIAARAYVDSVSVAYRSKFITKFTGFQSVRHVIEPTTGTTILCEVAIAFTGDIPTATIHQLRALAHAVNGAGMDITFNDDWADNMAYTGKWINAGDFVESFEGHYGANIRMAVHTVAAL